MRINGQTKNSYKNTNFTSISLGKVYIKEVLVDDPKVAKTFIDSLQRILTTPANGDIRCLKLQEDFHNYVKDYSNANIGRLKKGFSVIRTHFDTKKCLGYFFSGMQVDNLNQINENIRFGQIPIDKYSKQVQEYVNSGGKLKNSDGDELIINIHVGNKLTKGEKPSKELEISHITSNTIPKQIDASISLPVAFQNKKVVNYSSVELPQIEHSVQKTEQEIVKPKLIFGDSESIGLARKKSELKKSQKKSIVDDQQHFSEPSFRRYE